MSPLSDLRKEAVKKKVLDEFTHPRNTFNLKRGVTELNCKESSTASVPHRHLPVDSFEMQSLSDTLQEIIREIWGEDTSVPHLHPRPRHIFGDSYTPVRDGDPGVTAYTIKRASRKFKPENAKKCKPCTSGQACIRNKPSRSGTALAILIKTLRATQKKPSYRRLKDAFWKPRLPPGPSPLSSMPFISDASQAFEEYDSSDDSLELDSIDDSAAGICPTLSREELMMRREFGVYIVKGGETVWVGDYGVFSSGCTYLDVMGAYPSSDGYYIPSGTSDSLSPGKGDGYDPANDAA